MADAGRENPRRSARVRLPGTAALGALLGAPPGALLAALFAVLVPAGCDFGPSRLAGGASETEATLAGRILKPDGSAAAGVSVRLRPSLYLRDTALAGLPKDAARPRASGADGRTDAQGYFRFDSLFLGDYSIEALDGAGLGAHLRASVTAQGRTFTGEDVRLGPLSELKGRVSLPPGASAGAYVQVYGLDRAARADSAGAFALAGLPPGIFSLRVTPVSPMVSARSVYGVVLLPMSVEDLGEVALPPSLDAEDYGAWNDSARILVDASGLDGGLGGFPLLLRLDRSNFDFTASTGLDLRFASRSGRHLPYEVEHWDPLAGRAVIWLRADTLPAAEGAYALMMYWNRPGAPGKSDGDAVFDSAEGWQGVWHLGRDPAAPAAPADPSMAFRDASGGANHARGEGLDSAGQAAGVAHLAQALDGRAQSIRTSKAFAGPDTFTLSLWFKTSTSEGGRLAGFGSHQEGPSLFYDRHVWMDNLGRLHFGVFPGPDSAVAPGVRRILSTGNAYNDGLWHHVAARLSAEGQALFVDGVRVGFDPGTRRASHYAGFWRFGYDNLASWEFHPASQHFRGALDEVRVTRRALPDAWIRFDAESQRPGSPVVSILR